jgi:hypothetical protein
VAMKVSVPKRLRRLYPAVKRPRKSNRGAP